MARHRLSRAPRELHNPDPASVPVDFVAFLRTLGGPALIRIDGAHTRRPRAFSTLLHGNEPSGARALHRFLLDGERPAATLLCLVASVEAALCEPLLTHRFVPGQRDLNRCFRAPFDDAPGELARWFIELLEREQPECLVDIHNTSALSPGFAIAPHEDRAHETLAAYFCRHLVITDLALGALMERSGRPCPAITVECGAARDGAAEMLAWEGLLAYARASAVLDPPASACVLDLYHHPVRLELAPDTRLAWHDGPLAGRDLVLRPDLERFNFGTVEAGTAFAWLGERGRAPLRVRDGRGEDVFERYFRVAGARLLAAQPLKLFMVTSDARMALGDCLLYATTEREHTHEPL